MTVKEKARNYVWSRVESAERDLEEYNEKSNRLSLDHIENTYRAAVSRRLMFNYLFKLIETDED